MSGKVLRALVTGSSSGIGRAVAAALLAKGYSVVGLSRTPGDIEDPSFEHTAVDFEELDALPAILRTLTGRFAELDVLVLCAGRGLFGSLEELSYEQIRSLMNLNFVSQAYVARAFVPIMKRRRQGQIVVIGSEAAHQGAARGTVYCASKFALRGFAQALRQEASGSGLRVTFISPAMTRTPFYDALAFEPGAREENALTAEDVAEAVMLAVASRKQAVVDEIRLSPLKRVVQRKEPGAKEP